MMRTLPPIECFRNEVERSIHGHAVLLENPYTQWFALGEATDAQLRAFTVQFSVFSHLFIEAQLRKCINAPDIGTYRSGKQILMNELGVSFGSDGSVDGGTFRFHGAHYEWLVDFAEHLGLEWHELGKRRLGTPSTLRFCDSLTEWYGSEDISTALGASYAIEHWANAGFWKSLIAGLRKIRAQRRPDLPLGFWTWHDRLEELHAQHTEDELSVAYSRSCFIPERFIAGGIAMLDAVTIFWNGLAAQRRELENERLRYAV